MLQQLFTDDDSAVSPVIGVILMVAITVILAAVIASFVLGLGDSADEVQPNTSFTFDYEDEGGMEGNVTITLSDGEALDYEEVYIRGQNLTQSGNVGTTSWEANRSSGGQWSAGESYVVKAGSDYTINVVWESADTDDSSRLQTDEGPDA